MYKGIRERKRLTGLRATRSGPLALERKVRRAREAVVPEGEDRVVGIGSGERLAVVVECADVPSKLNRIKTGTSDAGAQRNALLDKVEAELLEVVLRGRGGLRVFFGAGCCLGGGGWGIGIGRTSGWWRRGSWV
jgi:hypothetical protein